MPVASPHIKTIHACQHTNKQSFTFRYGSFKYRFCLRNGLVLVRVSQEELSIWLECFEGNPLLLCINMRSRFHLITVVLCCLIPGIFCFGPEDNFGAEKGCKDPWTSEWTRDSADCSTVYFCVLGKIIQQLQCNDSRVWSNHGHACVEPMSQWDDCNFTPTTPIISKFDYQYMSSCFIYRLIRTGYWNILCRGRFIRMLFYAAIKNISFIRQCNVLLNTSMKVA